MDTVIGATIFVDTREGVINATITAIDGNIASITIDGDVCGVISIADIHNANMYNANERYIDRDHVLLKPLEGQTIKSSEHYNPRNCTEGWTAKVTTTNDETVTIMIEENRYYPSCLEDGCAEGENNDRVGELFQLDRRDFWVNEHGEIVVQKAIWW